MTGSDRYSVLRRLWWLKWLLLVLWAAGVIALLRPIIAAHQFVTLQKILKRGEISMITRYSPHSYYTYRDQPMGFEYDLASEFAAYLNVELNVIIVDNWDDMVQQLEKGRGAVIAAGLPVSAKRKRQVSFSNGYMEIQPHLIANRRHQKIQQIEQLADKSIHVSADADYLDSLAAVKDRGVAIDIHLNANQPTEELIRLVAEGEIEFTVAQSHIALLNRRHYPDALATMPVGEPQWLAWATSPRAKALLTKTNQFFELIMRNGRFDQIYSKYYGDIHEFDYVDLRTFHRRIDSRLSRYSPFIKEAAGRHGFDWRLIAAQMYQESHLYPWAQSTAGARGLMQLLPATAESLGVSDIYSPVENIDAGVQHLRNLYDQFKASEGRDRLLISLAAYNTGIGHILDAQRLAVELGLDPNKWASLRETLPMLKFRKYYKNAKHGYCRGDEPVSYVKQIRIYYDILRRRGIDDALTTGGEEIGGLPG